MYRNMIYGYEKLEKSYKFKLKSNSIHSYIKN